MKPRENKPNKSHPHQENIYHDGGTLTHYLGNDDYKDGNRENDEESKNRSKEIGHVAHGNVDSADLRETNT